MSHLFRKFQTRADLRDANKAKWESRADAIYEGCNPVQRAPIDSVKAGYQYLSLRCPRRSGKSHGLTSLGLWYGENFPNSRILIISLTLKSTKENFWSGAPGGIFKQNYTHGLELKFNSTDLTWIHQNGSRGRLAGAETIADIEHLRGAAAEADLAIVDECKSFAPELLAELIRDVLEPGLMTRDGVMVLSGTPGSIPIGVFYEATAEQSRTDTGFPTCIHVGEEDGPAYASLSKRDRKDLWRLHTWTIRDNVAAPKQWDRALSNKKRQGWDDEHPTWRREYLGQWVTDASDLVYAWAGYKDKRNTQGEGHVTWTPTKTRTNKSGLPDEYGPWHYVLGIDLGYVDDSALVLCAYSETLKELRHVYDFKAPEMTLDDFFDEIYNVIERYGRPDAIVADTAGGASKMLVETLNQRYGLGIEPAKKTEKQDHIELVNSDFAAGRIKIIPGSDLAHELSGLQWDLSRDSKLVLARTGRLREDPHCPNHLCDALLYLYRYSYHYWSTARETGPVEGSVSWWREWEEAQIERAVKRRQSDRADSHRLRRWASQGQSLTIDAWRYAVPSKRRSSNGN